MTKTNYSLRSKEKILLLLFAFLFSLAGTTYAQLLGQEGFKLVGAGTTWTQQGPKITANDAVGAARQGFSVSISADGNTAVAGGYLDNNPTGATWVYTLSGGGLYDGSTVYAGTSTPGVSAGSNDYASFSTYLTGVSSITLRAAANTTRTTAGGTIQIIELP